MGERARVDEQEVCLQEDQQENGEHLTSYNSISTQHISPPPYQKVKREKETKQREGWCLLIATRELLCTITWLGDWGERCINTSLVLQLSFSIKCNARDTICKGWESFRYRILHIVEVRLGSRIG